MSLSYYEGMKPVKLPDPRIDIRTQNKYLFKQPANVVTYKSFNSNSSSNNSTHFTATPPNPNIIISPLVYLHVPTTVNVNGLMNNADPSAPAAANEVVKLFSSSPSAICPRQLPISSIIGTLSLKLNTDTTTVNLNDYIHALSRYYSDDAIRAYEMSSSPVQPDFYQKYGDLIPGPDAFGTTATAEKTRGLGYGTNRSPFGNYGENTNESTRKSYKYNSLVSVAGSVTATYDFDEPLFISPLSSGDYSKMGLVQVQTFDLDITWDSKLERMFSCNFNLLSTTLNSNAGRAAVAVNPRWAVTIGQPELRFIYMTPHINYPIPETIIYEFSELNRITKSISAQAIGWDPVAAPDAANGPENTIISDNIQLSSIPNKVYIYVRRSNATRDVYSADAFCRIKRINVDFNGVSGILASASEHDLWRMSCDSGLRVSWDAWRFYGGSVLCIDFGKNIGLSPQQGVGMLGTYNFSYQLQFANINTEDMDVELYTLIESVGTLTIQNQQVIKQVGILTSRDAIDAPDASQGEAKIVESLYGGSFMSGMKNLYANTKSFAKKASPYIKEGLSILQDPSDFIEKNPKLIKGVKTGAKVAAHLLPLIGLGYTQKQLREMQAAGYTKKDFQNLARTMQGAPVGRGGNMLGGNPVGGAGRIGFPTGGAMIGKDKLMNRVQYNY